MDVSSSVLAWSPRLPSVWTWTAGAGRRVDQQQLLTKKKKRSGGRSDRSAALASF
jgi:hypothetical protein